MVDGSWSGIFFLSLPGRQPYTLVSGDLFPLGAPSTLARSAFSKQGLNNHFKEPEFDVSGDMSDETRQNFARDTGYANATSAGKGHWHQVAAMLTK